VYNNLENRIRLIDERFTNAKEKYMTEKEFQLKNLETIVGSRNFAPLLKKNSKYCTNDLAELTPYISYQDLENKRFAVRASPLGNWNVIDKGVREIIIEYSSLRELIDDGWQLAYQVRD
jgi:hypothetical protein